MDFSSIDYLDERACYTKLLELLHPNGVVCPQCGEGQRLGIHRRHRDPVIDFQCGTCRRVFNAWTDRLGGDTPPPLARPHGPPRDRQGHGHGTDGPGDGV